MVATELQVVDWRKSIEGLHTISEKFVPLYTRLEPSYARGEDRYYRACY